MRSLGNRKIVAATSKRQIIPVIGIIQVGL
jgi:hypothetical protein